ncbi:fimbrial protein [Enterobacter sp. Ap-1006]|uniref:fimbrial protein n=1 Tax=Enterobacter sp. Ap-1006 TaxID=2608345 RepID=UPI00142057C3|nr:fimbrial protein [Enterobacter sp. Ap-1006]NIF48661.1 fimbrial protein [Enterobacter sp. Ap-1006]
MKKRSLIGLGFGLLLATTFTHAANVNNQYFFIENQVDGEYFITPGKTDPRFSGANVFTRYAANDQLSLGYMGSSGSLARNSYADIWLEDSPISRPFIGNRCMRNARDCPSDGYLPGYIGKQGVYHISMTTTSGEAGTPRGIFSDSAYEYFRNLGVGSVEKYRYYYCYTNNNYNPAAGQTCATVGGRVGNHEFTMSKVGHMSLESTNALQEIFIDSAGNPIIGLGSEFCRVGYVGSQNGAICQMVKYKMKGSVLSPMRMSMKVNTAKMGFTPGSSTIRLSPNGSSGWVNYSSTTRASDLITSNNGGIYVFFSQQFLKELIARNVDLRNSQEFFTFLFTNTAVPQSGYYEFSPSNTIILRPRDYGISIVSKDLTQNQKREGKVGDKEPPLLFEYVVTTSGPRQADAITAQVFGPVVRRNGQPYCLFSSSDGKIGVPFSAYLSYRNNRGQEVSSRASCDNQPISLNAARWEQAAWPSPYQNDGRFYRTNLSLIFPMNEANSQYSMDGQDWMGVVSATGEVRVSATWSGPDIQ